MSAKKPVEEKVGSVAPFGLRMLPDLKARVEASARLAGRSLNAEIVATLEEKYPAPVTLDGPDWTAWLGFLIGTEPGATLDKKIAVLLRAGEQQKRTGVMPSPPEGDLAATPEPTADEMRRVRKVTDLAAIGKTRRPDPTP